jgi:hypothetical protein
MGWLGALASNLFEQPLMVMFCISWSTRGPHPTAVVEWYWFEFAS